MTMARATPIRWRISLNPLIDHRGKLTTRHAARHGLCGVSSCESAAAFPARPLSAITGATQYAGRVRIHAIFGGIGAFAVKFRWVVIAAWLVAAIAVPHFLPSLNSVTQGNNSAFLPASAPSEKAAQLAAPFGSTNLIPVPVVAAVSQGTLGTADTAWLSTLQHDLGPVPTVVSVRDLGRSADQQAEQLQVMSDVSGGDQAGLTTLIKDLRAQITRAGPPAGLQVHLAGDIAINVDQQTKSGTTGNQVELLSALFILVLLLLIFRSLLAPLI